MPARRKITFRSQIELCRAFTLGRKSGAAGFLSIAGDKLIYKGYGERALVVARRHWDACFTSDRPRYALLLDNRVPTAITNKVRKSLNELGLPYHEIPMDK